tara:strand:- start:576 stop:1898 length:1323 start_codon:yes stop_codon:yes gene_type:complete
MSSFGNTTTRIIDPVFDRAGFRAEFRLPPGNVYMSNMRLLNIGITSSLDDSYNNLVGALSVIRSIAIFDGSQLLDQINIADLVLAFKSANRRNDENISQYRQLQLVGTGYVASGQYTMTGSVFDNDDIKVRKQTGYSNNVGKNAWISLRELLDFCRSSMIIPTSTFKQLRVVVDYHQSAFINKNCVLKNNGTTSSTASALLVVDEVNDGEAKDSMMSGYEGVVFRPLETDSVVVPSVSGVADNAASSQIEKTHSFLVNGFNNKRLSKIAVFQQPTDAGTWQSGTGNVGFMGFASKAQWRSSLQVRINGSNVLPGAGIQGTSSGIAPTAADPGVSVQGGSRANRTLRKLTETWGSFNVVPCMNWCGSTQRTDLTQVQGMGDLDIFGLRIEENVNEFQLQYSRFGLFDNQTQNQQLNLVIIGEVEKAVVMNRDGTYNVVYSQ